MNGASIRSFSTITEPGSQKQKLPEIEVPVPTAISGNLKSTPAAGYKQAKPKRGEVSVGHRVYGDTDIFSKP